MGCIVVGPLYVAVIIQLVLRALVIKAKSMSPKTPMEPALCLGAP